MTRYLNMLSSWEAFGSDVNPDHVKWCQENLKQVETRLNGAAPPLHFETANFDLVYSMSIFTHLPESSAIAWLREFKRVLKPNGTLIVTTHGIPALETILSSPAHLQMMIRPRLEFENILKKFSEVPYVFQAYEEHLIDAAKAGKDYGNTFIHPDYATELWTKAGFRLHQHLPGGMRAWQDIFVLSSVPC